MLILGALHRPSPKILSRGEERSSLKYIMSVLLSDFEYFVEKSLASRLEFGFPFSSCPNSWRQNYQKVLPCTAM